MVDKAFVANFEAEVHVQYQKIGSKLRNTVRTKDNVVGATTTFQKVGKDNTSKSSTECTLYSSYAGDWVDRLDDLKANISEQQIVAKAGAYALGRKTDEMIINQLATATNFAGSDTDELTKLKVLTAFELLGETDVPDDGQRFAVVGWKQWSNLLNIDEFANANYVDEDVLPWKGTQAKKWLGTLWVPHSGLPKFGGVRSCFWYHKTAVGHAIGAEVKTSMTYFGDHAAHFVSNMLNQGACLIDASRVVTLKCLEN